jgi:hypothetical protein
VEEKDVHQENEGMGLLTCDGLRETLSSIDSHFIFLCSEKLLDSTTTKHKMNFQNSKVSSENVSKLLATIAKKSCGIL